MSDTTPPSHSAPYTPATGQDAGAPPPARYTEQSALESDARKNTITAAVTTLVPLVGVFLLVLGASGVFPLTPYVVAPILVLTLGCAITAPVYSIKALTYAKRSRGTAKGQVGIVLASFFPILFLVGVIVVTALVIIALLTYFQ